MITPKCVIIIESIKLKVIEIYVFGSIVPIA